MKFGMIVAAGMILALGSTAAMAGSPVPKLTGAYVLVETDICQIGFAIQTESSTAYVLHPYVSSIDPISNGVGKVKDVVGTATFKPTSKSLPYAGTVSFSETVANGSLMTAIYNGGGPNNTDGTPITTASQSGSAVFANTATTIELGDSNHVYTPVYSSVVKGVAQRVDYVGSGSGNTCAVRGSLIAQ